ncbi:MAG: MerR family transcriptional regulator [Nitrospirae bacterium]|nr:MerR family transcriptional regulator [Nitrospirota bacterium]
MISETDPILSIGVVARMAGVSTHTIRLYEREGLLRPSRTETGRRLYAGVDADLVRATRRLLAERLNFSGIRRLFASIPCWSFKPCCIPRLGRCTIQDRPEWPCWSVEDSWCRRTGQVCQTCRVYKMATEIDNVRSNWDQTLREGRGDLLQRAA